MSFEFGDAVLVPFPFTDQTSSKRRPAVIVSSPAYNGIRSDVVVMAITSQSRPSSTFGEVWLDRWQAAGRLKPSAVKPVFATLAKSLFIRRLGTHAAEDRARLRTAIAGIIL